jgi:hypothetical protein
LLKSPDVAAEDILLKALCPLDAVAFNPTVFAGIRPTDCPLQADDIPARFCGSTSEGVSAVPSCRAALSPYYVTGAEKCPILFAGTQGSGDPIAIQPQQHREQGVW